MSRVFFYGLFMDPDLLRGKGLHPTPVGPAELPDFRLFIGDRASLIPSPGSTAYGMLIELPDDELATLYAAPDVASYRPEFVDAILLEDRSIQTSLCYNLPADQLGAGTNVAYAERLATLLIELGLPGSYARRVSGREDTQR